MSKTNLGIYHPPRIHDKSLIKVKAVIAVFLFDPINAVFLVHWRGRVYIWNENKATNRRAFTGGINGILSSKKCGLVSDNIGIRADPNVIDYRPPRRKRPAPEM